VNPAWEVLFVLRDIVEPVVSQVHTEETICFLDSKISEHKHRFLMVFPEQRLIPKHHFLEHYPELIGDYGPLVSLWTMRFEAKHSFFKRVVRHTRSFRGWSLSQQSSGERRGTPGQVASPSQGHIETNETNNHTHTHTHS